MTTEITTSDNVIDSRDIIARIEELEADREALAETVTERQAMRDETNEDDDERDALQDDLDASTDALTEWDEGDEGQELKALKALADEADGYVPDWHYGACLINESYFTEYCQELLAEIGDLPRDLPDYIVIDWDATAENLKVDYTEVDFNGTTYLVR